MKANPPVLLFVMFLALPAACAMQKTAGKGQFHPPQTGAEKALDRILKAPDKNFKMLSFVRSDFENRTRRGDLYRKKFSRSLLRDWSIKESSYVDNCFAQGSDKDICGLYTPITCIGEMPNVPYLYRTAQEDGRTATIYYTWHTYDEHAYRLVKESHGWVIDAVNCGSVSYNTTPPIPLEHDK